MKSRAPVSAQMIRKVATRSCVRNLRRPIQVLALFPRNRNKVSGQELVAGAVHGQEISRIAGVGLELLPQAQNVIVHRASRWIVLISPYCVQKLFARNSFSR